MFQVRAFGKRHRQVAVSRLKCRTMTYLTPRLLLALVILPLAPIPKAGRFIGDAALAGSTLYRARAISQ
jgi:hypothetical protein